jgi:hypothetical protein
MNFETSNCLKEYKKIHVDINTFPGNITAYIIRETQGAEYGQEAENVRSRFEAAMKTIGVTISEATLEGFQNFLDIDCADMDREDYRDLLEQIASECKARLNAMDEDEIE